mgnify:CR=1 FL=1
MITHDDIERSITSLNNRPVDDFSGLSPAQMHELLYNPFGPDSPVKLRDDIDEHTLDMIPLFRVAEAYLKIIRREEKIKLTQRGALPRMVVFELYNKGYLTEEDIEYGITKLSKEDDCVYIKSARLTAELAGYVRKANGKLTLTKSAQKLLDTNNRLELFKGFFQTFVGKFSWSYNDAYPELPIGQFGWAYTLMLLDKHGDQPQSCGFYADKYLCAFPGFLDYFTPEIISPEKHIVLCYCVRTFVRFSLWFGLVKIDKTYHIIHKDTDQVRKTELIEKVFKMEFKLI